MSTAHQKNIICTAKNSICTSKIAISIFSYTIGIFLSFGHTFSYFCILSQLLAHCADLSKSDGQLCCCHETGLKPGLVLVCISGRNSITSALGAIQIIRDTLGEGKSVT